MYSCCGCLRPPWGGTDAIVPSRILSSACCTPSPDTSRVILRFSRDLVDLVDIDDPALALGYVELARLEQPDQDVLHILADVTGLGEGGGIGDGEGNVENAGQCLGQQSLADSGRAQEQDVGLI